jgi:hypothetical protein
VLIEKYIVKRKRLVISAYRAREALRGIPRMQIRGEILAKLVSGST